MFQNLDGGEVKKLVTNVAHKLFGALFVLLQSRCHFCLEYSFLFVFSLSSLFFTLLNPKELNLREHKNTKNLSVLSFLLEGQGQSHFTNVASPKCPQRRHVNIGHAIFGY